MRDSSYYFGWEVNAFSNNHHVIISENFLLFLVLLCGCLVLQHYVEKEYKITFLPGALATMLVSVVVGGIIRLSIPHDGSFSPLVIGFSSDVLYFGLLPPIIFDSAYHLRRRLFFRNLGAVFALACSGTIVVTILTALGITLIQHFGAKFGIDVNFTFMERIAFACALSATDPVSTLAVFSNLKVDPTLFYAMLGESVLNDAVAITAFRVSSRLIDATSLTYLDGIACAVNFIVLAIGSSIIGYSSSVLVALGLKHTHFGKDKVVPMGVVVCAMYIPFFLAEILQLSGVVAIFFGGIAARRYVHKNLTLEVRRMAAFIFHLMAHCAETTCFVLLGLSVFLVDFPFAQLPFMLLVLVVCLLARPMAVYPLLGMLNLYRRRHIHPNTAISASVSAIRAPSKISPGYDSLPTAEENLEAGCRGGVAGDTGNVQNDVLDRPRSHASPSDKHLFAAPSSPHVHFAPPSPSVLSAVPGIATRVGPLSGLRHSLSSDSSLTGYEAAADVKGMKLPLAKPITLANMHVIAFAGMRGAVSFSLAYIFPNSHGNRDLVLCTAIVIVLFTSFFNGTLTEPLIRWLDITTNVDIADYLKKHEVPDDVFEFERLVLYPLILKPRAEPYHKTSEKNTPICGSCDASVNQAVDLATGRGGSAYEDPLPPQMSALTPSTLQRAGVSLHNFFHDRGFYHMHSNKQHERTISDAMSSGGGSLISTEDYHHIHNRSHSPERYPGVLNLHRTFSPYAQTNHHAPRVPHLPLHRRSASAGQKSSTFSSSPPILPSLTNPFASAPLVLTKVKPSELCSTERPTNALSQAATTQMPSSLIEELKLVIAQRGCGTPSASPAPYSGIAGAGASVFNHLNTPNAFYTPLLRALSPAEPALERDVTPHRPGPAPITPPTRIPDEYNKSLVPTCRTVPHALFTASATTGNHAVSLRGTSAGLLGDTLGAETKILSPLGTASALDGVSASADSTPSTEEGLEEETQSVFRIVGEKV